MTTVIPWLDEFKRDATGALTIAFTTPHAGIAEQRLLALCAIAAAAETWMDQVGYQSDLEIAMEKARKIP